jgi:hypothetical protein
MKYAMMGAGLRAEVGRTPPTEQERRIRCHQQALNDLLRARIIAGRTGLNFVSVGLGPFHGGEGQTLSVRNREGKRLRTDGPFPETKEVVGGFDIIDFASREEAIEFGKVKNMHATHIEEIRPIREFWWISHSPKLAEANIFMFSSVEDGRGASDLSTEERKKLIRQHQAVGAEYVTQRGMVDGKPGLGSACGWVRPPRQLPSGETLVCHGWSRVPSPRPARCSAASISSRATHSTKPSAGPRS